MAEKRFPKLKSERTVIIIIVFMNIAVVSVKVDSNLSDGLESFSMKNWMAAIDDDQLLSNLTIPGAEDRFPRFYRFQSDSLTTQLDFGVRFFNLEFSWFEREGGEDRMNRMVATSIYVFGEIFKFLAKNPSEVILFTISPYNRGKYELELNIILEWEFKKPKHKHVLYIWGVKDGDVPLGSVRGKLIWIRKIFGIWNFVDDWNVPTYDSIINKWYRIGQNLLKACDTLSTDYYFTYFRAESRDYGKYEIAKLLNIELQRFLEEKGKSKGKKRFGIVSLEFVYEAVCRDLVYTNFI